MVWTTAHFDRNHWNPEQPMKSIEVFVANEYRAKNPDAQIRLINWDPPMTHYGHLELPKQLAAAHYQRGALAGEALRHADMRFSDSAEDSNDILPTA